MQLRPRSFSLGRFTVLFARQLAVKGREDHAKGLEQARVG